MALAHQYSYMKVQIGTVDFTSYLADTEQVATMPIGAEVGRATLSFRDDGSMPDIPKWGTVIIKAGTAAPGTSVWGGFATRQSSEPFSMHGGTVRTVTVDCQSYAIALTTTEPITETYGGGDHDALILDYAIVSNLAQTYLAPFYDAGSISSANPVQCDYIQFSEETFRSSLNKIGERSAKEYGISADAKFFYRPTGSAGTLAHELTDSPDMNSKFPMQAKPYSDRDDVEVRNAVRVLGGWSLSAVQTEPFTTDGFAYQFQVAYPPQDIIRVSLSNIVQSVGVYLVDDPADFDVLVWYDQRKFLYQLPPEGGKTLEIVYRYPVRVEEDVFDAASIAEVGATLWAATIQDSSISDATVAQIAGSAHLSRSATSVARGQITTNWVGTAVPYLPGHIVPVTTQALGWDREELEIQAVTMRFSPRPGDIGSCLTYWDLDVGSPETLGRTVGESFSDSPAIHVQVVVPNIRSITKADLPDLDLYLLATGARTGASSQAQTFMGGAILGEAGTPASLYLGAEHPTKLWRFKPSSVVFEGTRDDVLNIGFNAQEAGEHTDLTATGMSFQMENNYKVGASNSSEFFFTWDNAANTVNRRPLQINMEHSTGAAIIAFRGSTYFRKSDNSTSLFEVVEPSGNAVALGYVDASNFYRAGGKFAFAAGLHSFGFGDAALGAGSPGDYNVAVGYLAGGANTGNYNLFFGASSGAVNAGTFNAFIGYEAGLGNTSGDYNMFLGGAAGRANTQGDYNIAIGGMSLYQNTTSGKNIAIGILAGYALTGEANTIIGFTAGYTASAANGSVFLGNEAGYYETASNKLFIDNRQRASEADARAKALIYGVFDAATANQYLDLNANVKILGNVGLFGHAVAAQPAAYSVSGASADRSFNASATNLTEVANVLATLISDLQSYGAVG